MYVAKLGANFLKTNFGKVANFCEQNWQFYKTNMKVFISLSKQLKLQNNFA
jgi:hypothetical protein